MTRFVELVVIYTVNRPLIFIKKGMYCDDKEFAVLADWPQLTGSTFQLLPSAFSTP
jgi:hypothetical protein